MMRTARAFTLIELVIVLVVVGVFASALAFPLAMQVQLHRYDETRRSMDEAKEALLGFAAANARLPCPAAESSRGEESFAPGGDAANGACSHFYSGYLPAAALGMTGVDNEGFLRDAWGGPRNRIRYAVFGGGAAINGITNPLTRANGMQAATLPGLAGAAHFLFICLDGAQVNASGCGPAANQLTRRAAFVLLSLGPNAATPPAPGSDEARNLDADPVFVWHEPAAGPGNEFDDLVQWTAVHLVANRLITAGRLP